MRARGPGRASIVARARCRALHDYASAASFAAGFGPAMGACAGLALLGAVAGLAIPGRPKPASANAQPVQHVRDPARHVR